MHNAIPRLCKSGVLLNLLPVVIICWWIFVVFPRISIVVEKDPFHPALVGFYSPEQSVFGIYRWLSSTSFLGCLISIPVGMLSYLFSSFKNKLLLSALVCLVFINILVNGVGFEPDGMYQKSSHNPFVAHFDRYGDNYWQENILMQMMIYYARFFDYEYYLFHFFMILTAYTVILLLFENCYGEYLSLIATAVLATSQLTTVAFS